MWIALAVLMIIGIVAVAVLKRQHAASIQTKRNNLESSHHDYNPDQINMKMEAYQFPVPAQVTPVLGALAFIFLGVGTFNQVFFYAEPGYIYHVRTILGQERVVDGVGYSMHLFGRKNDWKKAMTVQATSGGSSINDELGNAEGDNSAVSARLPALNIMFLDQVDADAYATTRFKIPVDRESFLTLAHEYRTPENFLRTALVPAFKETLQANASLMSAEEYYSGSRTEFNTEFENQMKNGVYIVKRIEVVVYDPTANLDGSANASKAKQQTAYGDSKKVVFEVQKQYSKDGTTLLRKAQKYTSYGVTVVDARITDMKPNSKFVGRMQLKQKASADRAIAREQRVQEEEQKLLAEARGAREVAERQAKAKVEQIEKTTNAETDKQLAITSAEKLLAQAEIDKDTSVVRLAQAKIDAEKIETLADATAYQKRVVLEADNALAQKLEAEVQIQEIWANAFSKRSVPQYVFSSGGGGSDGATPVGSDSEVSMFMKLMTVDAAKRLNYDRGLTHTAAK